MHRNTLYTFVFVAVYYASGSSIAKFPKDGYLVTQTLKDQGNFFLYPSFSSNCLSFGIL